MGINGLNEELGRHGGKNDDRHCRYVHENECYVLGKLECPVYDTIEILSCMHDGSIRLGGRSFENMQASLV